jgi:hypothetical protein
LWLRHFLNNWFGRRLRFLLGAALLAAGLLWMHQNQLITQDNPILAQAQSGDIIGVLNALTEPLGNPANLPGLPPAIAAQVNSYRIPIIGLCVLFSALFFFGWRSSVPAVVGVVVAVAGPKLGIPNAGEVSAGLLSLAIGIVVILGLGWFLRK